MVKNSKSIEEQINRDKKVVNHLSIMLSCFIGFFIWNLMNFISLYRTWKWWISIRTLINLILWPWIWVWIGILINKIWYSINKKKKEAMKKWKFITFRILIILWYFIIIFFLIFISAATINNWFEKINCEVEKETINYLSCVNETKNNILNIQRMFKND